MEKNTKIAIGLSSAVLIVSLGVQFIVSYKNGKKQIEQQKIEEQKKLEEELNNPLPADDGEKVSEEISETTISEEIEVPAVEKPDYFALETDKVIATFTDMGGDLVSYKLKDHKDKDYVDISLVYSQNKEIFGKDILDESLIKEEFIGKAFVEKEFIDPKFVDFAAIDKKLEKAGRKERMDATIINEETGLVDLKRLYDELVAKNIYVEKELEKELIKKEFIGEQYVPKKLVNKKFLNKKNVNLDELYPYIEMIRYDENQNNRALSLSLGGFDEKLMKDNAISDKFDKKVEDKKVSFFNDFIYRDDTGKEFKYTIMKVYTFMDDEEVFKLDVNIFSEDEEFGLDINNTSYTLRTAPQIGPKFDVKKNRYDVRHFVSLVKNKKFKKNFAMTGDMNNPKAKSYSKNKDFKWAGTAGKYFCMLVYPNDANETEKAKINQEVNTLSMGLNVDDKSGPEAGSQVFISRKKIEKNDLRQGLITDSYYIYMGPRNEKELVRYNKADKNKWKISNAKFNNALNTSGFLTPIEFLLRWALKIVYGLDDTTAWGIKNWGIAIIIVTILLKLALFPLSRKSALGNVKLQELSPKLQAIQEKYKDDQKRLQVESAKIYQEAGYNPMSGCLPMILQMIVLFAMYNVFNNYFEFRGASFIPGWIDDLSVGDSVLTWERNIPFISGFTQNNLRILPILYTATQLLNGKITQYGNAGAANGKKSMWFMTYGLPVLFFFLFYNVPSGLLLYWATSNILQIGQQILINRSVKKHKQAAMEKSKPSKFNYVGGDKKKKKIAKDDK